MSLTGRMGVESTTPSFDRNHPTQTWHTWTSSWHCSRANRSRSSPQHEHFMSAPVHPETELRPPPPWSGRRVAGHPLDAPLPGRQTRDAPEAHANLGVLFEAEQAGTDSSITA